MPMTSAASSSSRSASMARPMRERRSWRKNRSSTATVMATPPSVVAWRIPPNPDAAPVGSKFRKKMRTISPKPMVRISR